MNDIFILNFHFFSYNLLVIFMNIIQMAFLLTTLAGLSTLLGIIPILIPIKNEKKIIAGSLAFAAGVMLCVSITDLILESVHMLDEYMNSAFICFVCFLFIFLGMISSSIIGDKVSNVVLDNSLYKVGIISMLAIVLHNIPEGIATFISTTKDTSLGISLTIAIALHNIPEGISIGIPIYYSTHNKGKAFLYTFVSALSEPFGAFITYLFLLPFMNNLILGFLFSFIAGVMIQIAMAELLPTSCQYGNSKLSYSFFIIGILFMLFKFIF